MNYLSLRLKSVSLIILFSLLSNLKLLAQTNISSDLLGLNVVFPKEKIIKPLVANSGMESYLIGIENKPFEYTLTITKDINTGLKFKDLKEEEYKNSYLKNCNSTVIGTQDKKYLKGIESHQFNTIINNKDQKLYGFVDNVVNKGNVFAFVYLTTKENFDRFKDDYYSILNEINPIEIKGTSVEPSKATSKRL